jgi:hypothetical protein
MITIERIDVRPVKVDKVMISWKFTPSFESFANYSFELQRSRAPDSDYETVYRFTDASQYLDDVQYKRLWSTLYYRIKTTNTSDGKTVYSAAYSMGYAPNMEALEIIRRHDILLRNKRHGTGVPVIVMLRKHQGIQCTCWDPDKKRVRISNCEECFGTGFYEGFHAPIITWANLTPDKKEIQIPQWGEAEQNNSRIFLSNYPVVSPKDVIINTEKMVLWTVEASDTSERRGCLLHQLLTVSFLDRSSVLYKLLEKYPEIIDSVSQQQSRIEKS